MKILVTGSAGFIGFHLIKQLLERGDEVIGLDSINDYYDPNLKYGRLAASGIKQYDISYNKMVQSDLFPNYRFAQLQLEDRAAIEQLFKEESFDAVCNLAAQAGVRYSLEQPRKYIDSNIVGFLNILEACRNYEVGHLVYASSSSVYGMNKSIPFSEKDGTNHPISLYAATKKSNELMAHTYSHLFGVPTTGLRFFTVYGPWGRPDMAYYIFANKIAANESIDVYNFGEMKRDFTYVDDVVEGVIKVIDRPAQGNSNWDAEKALPNESSAPYKIYNIGNNQPVDLMEFIHTIEEAMGTKAQINLKPIQAGDVEMTWADVNDLINDFNYRPTTTIQEGISNFVAWFKEFHITQKK